MLLCFGGGVLVVLFFVMACFLLCRRDWSTVNLKSSFPLLTLQKDVPKARFQNATVKLINNVLEYFVFFN